VTQPAPRSATELGESELTAVATVLERAGVDLDGALSAELIAGGRSNLTFCLTDGTRRWVLRTPPRTGRTPSAHDIAREHRVTTALAGTGVPVAEAIALCADESLIGGPFTIAAFVDGRSIQTQRQLAEVSDPALTDVARSLIEVLAALHRVDYTHVGLEDFGRPDGYAQRQLGRWTAQWDIVGDSRLGKLAAAVRSRLAEMVPEQRSTSIVHGDFRIDNTLVDLRSPTGPHLTAVVDWELSTIGDPVADVAMMCGYRSKSFDLVVGEPSAWTSDRLPNVDRLAAAYEAAGGVPLADWDFHCALAYFKIAVIAAGIAHRNRAGAASGPGFDTAGEAVGPYLSLALDRLRRGH